MRRVLLLALLPPLIAAASLDPDIKKALADRLDDDRLVLSVADVRPRRRHRQSTENLLSVVDPQQSFLLKLDRKAKQVVLRTNTETRSVKVDWLTETNVIDSLIILFDQLKENAIVTVYVDCQLVGKMALSTNLRTMFDESLRDRLDVYRERRYMMELDSNTDVSEVLRRYKCDHIQMQEQAQPENTNDISLPPRGDIPVLHDCDDNILVKTIKDLTKVVKKLQEELEGQRVETRNLRQLLEQCDVCRPDSGSRQTCSSYPAPCFPGVECRDTSDGPRCGRCPPGYVGDGKNCKPGVTCDQQPCYPGVRCYDTVEGFQCGPCPSGFTGNGQHCKPRAGCDNNPCSPGVQCQNAHDPPFYRCGPCPAGFTGNGTNCQDLDECDLAEPCDPRVHCTNLIPGFRCGACPAGFTGSGGFEGVGLETAARVRQNCYDIDECNDGRNGGCVPNSLCHNTEGSFTCGACKSGYVGNQTVGCHSSPGLCPDGTRCDSNAECIRTSSTRYGCKCKVGWAGDGRVCGRDRDLDGWPDYELSCSDQRCRKRNQGYVEY